MGRHQVSRYDFVYVATDIPPGMTITEWRRELARERAERRLAMCKARRARRRALLRHALRRLGAAVCRGPVRRQHPA